MFQTYIRLRQEIKQEAEKALANRVVEGGTYSYTFRINGQDETLPLKEEIDLAMMEQLIESGLRMYHEAEFGA